MNLTSRQSWQEWRKYALDPKYQESIQPHASPLKEYEAPFSDHCTKPEPDFRSPLRTRKLFESRLPATEQVVFRKGACEEEDYLDRQTTISSGFYPASEFLHQKFNEHTVELSMAQERAQLRTEVEDLRSSLFSALRREEELKAYLDDCNKVLDASWRRSLH